MVEGLLNNLLWGTSEFMVGITSDVKFFQSSFGKKSRFLIILNNARLHTAWITNDFQERQLGKEYIIRHNPWIQLFPISFKWFCETSLGLESGYFSTVLNEVVSGLVVVKSWLGSIELDCVQERYFWNLLWEMPGTTYYELFNVNHVWRVRSTVKLFKNKTILSRWR